MKQTFVSVTGAAVWHRNGRDHSLSFGQVCGIRFVSSLPLLRKLAMHSRFRFELDQIRPRKGQPLGREQFSLLVQSMLAFDAQGFVASVFRLSASLEEFRFRTEGRFKFYEPVDLHVKRADVVSY